MDYEESMDYDEDYNMEEEEGRETASRSRQSEGDQANAHGLYRRFSPNCREIFVRESLKFVVMDRNDV